MGTDIGNLTFYSPKTLLSVFTVINILTYLDRGVLSALLDKIEDVYSLSNFQGGALSGAYMLGYVAASPIFARLASSANGHRRQFKLMAIGLFIWCLAVVGCAFSVEFFTLCLARMITGVGEASFLCIAPPFIDHAAPPKARSQWLGLFYVAIPAGYAVGFGMGGAWVDASVLPSKLQWRALFVLEAALMLPFVLFCLRVHQRYNAIMGMQTTATCQTTIVQPASQTPINVEPLTTPLLEEELRIEEPLAISPDVASEYGDDTPQQQGLPQQEELGLKELCTGVMSNRLYLSAVLGYTTQTFTVGAFAFNGIQYLEEARGFSSTTAGTSFGALTVLTGIVGTFLGGVILDWMRKRHPHAHPITLAMKMSTILSAIALPFCVVPFLWGGIVFFFICLAVGEALLFGCLAPVNSALMWAVEHKYRAFAVAMSVVFTHMLGDAISPSILGALLDSTHKNWSLCMSLISAWLIWPVVLWGLGWFWSRSLTSQDFEAFVAREHPARDDRADSTEVQTQTSTMTTGAAPSPMCAPVAEPSSGHLYVDLASLTSDKE